MRLADFIEQHLEEVLGKWDEFAKTLVPAARELDAATLRDHGEEILLAIAHDLRTEQTRDEQERKSQGKAAPVASETAAQTHAILRASNGFSIRQLVSEYRALRASVLRLWADAGPQDPHALDDVGRFNEAIDQAVTESVDTYSTQVDRWRHLFLGALAHDLRTPLHSIILTAELISQRNVPPELTAYVERLTRGGRRMADLLDDLMDYNRVALGETLSISPRPADLLEVCRGELELLRGAHPGADIELSGSQPVLGSWDTARLCQALTNLVDNAVSYGDGGPIRVSVAERDGDALLSVANSGPTLNAADISNLFEPMKRGELRPGHAERVHLGLGLFIVRQAVEAHGGKVTVESALGETRFTLRLPKTQLASRTDPK